MVQVASGSNSVLSTELPISTNIAISKATKSPSQLVSNESGDDKESSTTNICARHTNAKAKVDHVGNASLRRNFVTQNRRRIINLRRMATEDEVVQNSGTIRNL